MKWKIHIRVDDIGWEFYSDNCEEVLAAGFIALERIGSGRKEVSVFCSCDGQNWNVHSFWVLS